MCAVFLYVLMVSNVLSVLYELNVLYQGMCCVFYVLNVLYVLYAQDGKCDDLFSALSGGEVKLTTTSRPRTPTQQRRRTSRLIRTTPCQG